jgi:hypothetical protein
MRIGYVQMGLLVQMEHVASDKQNTNVVVQMEYVAGMAIIAVELDNNVVHGRHVYPLALQSISINNKFSRKKIIF